MNEQPVNHGRLRLISGAIRITFGMRYPIRILPRLLITADFDEIWCRDGAYDREELSKLQKLKVKGQAQQKNILTELSDNDLCRR